MAAGQSVTGDSSRPGPLTGAEADLIAERLTERLIDAVTDPKTVERVTEAWSGSLDKMIGRGIRRMAGALLFVLLGVGVVKFELLGKIAGAFK